MFVYVGLGGFTAEGQIRAFQSGADTIVEFNTSGVGGAEMAIMLSNFLAVSLTSDNIFEWACGVSRIAVPVDCA